MNFTAKIEMGNAAFDPEGRNEELGRILRDIGRRVEGGDTQGTCRDYNGNVVGQWAIKGKR